MLKSMMMLLALGCACSGQDRTQVQYNKTTTTAAGQTMINKLNQTLFEKAKIAVVSVHSDNSFSGANISGIEVDVNGNRFLELCDVLDNGLLNFDYPFVGLMLYAKNEAKSTNLIAFKGDKFEQYSVRRQNDKTWNIAANRDDRKIEFVARLVGVERLTCLRIDVINGDPIGLFVVDSGVLNFSDKYIETKVRQVMKSRWYMREYQMISSFVGDFE